MEHSGEGRPPWNLRLTAVFVLAVVGVAAVVSFALYPRRPPAATPVATQPPVTVTVLQAAPADRPLLWFRDSSEASAFVLRAVDWTGHALGSLRVSCEACGVLSSPDGQRLLIGNQPSEGMGNNPDRVFDAGGKFRAVVDGFHAIWADDSQHLCALRARSTVGSDSVSTQRLVITDVTNAHTRFGGDFSTAVAAGAGTWTLVSCSLRTDRAVAGFFGPALRALRVLQPSTGRVVLGRSADDVTGDCGCPISSVVVSGDGSLAAESLDNGAVRAIDLRTDHDVPMRGSWIGRGPVQGLSWSGREAVTPFGVYSFPEGISIWQAPLPSYMIPSASDPKSEAILISLWLSSVSSGRPIIVRSNGGALKLPGSYLSQPPLPY